MRTVEQPSPRPHAARNSDAEILEWLRKHDFTKPEWERMIEAAKAGEGGSGQPQLLELAERGLLAAQDADPG